MDFTESINMEFKREYTNDIRKEIVAFANSQGGTIFIGVGDNGEVVGLPDADKVLQQVSNMLRDAIKPDVSIFTQCNIEAKDGKDIVKVIVQRGTDRPYYIAEKGLKPSGVYVRLGSSSAPASADAIRVMIKETDGDTFETTRSLNQELHFSFTLEEFGKRSLELSEPQMRNLGLIGNDGLFTNLGLLLSDECLHTVKVAVFQGGDKTEFKDRRDFGGCLLKQLLSVYEYTDLHNKTHSAIEGLLRVDMRDYPEIAIRETLLNAIVHRDYSFSGSTLISIFDNRIEFVTLGGLVPGLSLDAIKIGASQSRNERLANIFYRLKLIEAYGTGISKIIDSYAGQPVQPDFVVADGAFLVTLPNINAHDAARRPMIRDVSAHKVLEHLETHTEVSRRDVEQLLGIGQTAAGNILRRLEKEGSVQIAGRGKNSVYRLIRWGEDA